MKKLVVETTAPFQGLPELVAYDEGVFEKEGLHIEWADREAGVERRSRSTSPAPSDPAPIPLDEMQRTFDWLKSWGMLEATVSPVDLVDLAVQTQAHHTAE